MRVTYDIAEEKLALQRKIQRCDALYRLEQNPDFVTLFKMDYFRDEALQAVHELATYKAGSQEYTALLAKLQTISDVQHHLEQIKHLGAMAKEELKELNAIPLNSEYTNE